MEQVAGPIKLTLRPDVPAEWTDEITAEIQRRGLDNPLDVCRELIREGLDRAGSGAADSAVAGTMSPTEIAELQRWYRAHIAGRMVGGEGEPGADVPLERLYDEEIADADPVDLALMKAFYEGTLRPVPITPEEQERLIAELDAVAANTPGTPTRWM